MSWCRSLWMAAKWPLTVVATSCWSTLLGLTAGQIPASIWDLPEIAELLCKKGVHSFAIFQCEFSAPSSKPTRFLTSMDSFVSRYSGLHRLDPDGKYLGPLPNHCPHGPSSHTPLVGKDLEGRWKTAPSATYPADLCSWIATSSWPALLRLRGGEGQTMSKKQPKEGPGEVRKEGEQPAQNPSLGAMGTDEDPFHGTLVGALQEHHGMPMTCNWHAKPPTSYNDGCGLCSPGRWPPSRRNFQEGEAKVFIDRLAGHPQHSESLFRPGSGEVTRCTFHRGADARATEAVVSDAAISRPGGSYPGRAALLSSCDCTNGQGNGRGRCGCAGQRPGQ